MLQGLLITSAVAVLCLIAWRLYGRALYSEAFAVILVLGLGLRVFCSLDPFLHKWDERYHAVVAKNMIADPFKPMLYARPALPSNYQHWAGSSIWLHKQPVPLWAMALSMKFLGVSEFSLRLPSILLSTLAIFFTFLIGKYLFDKKTGVIASFFHSVNGLVIELTAGRNATDHIDIFFLFFVELAILFIVLNYKNKHSRYIYLAGIALGMAILSKWLPALIVVPVFVVLRGVRITEVFALIAIAAIIALPWQIYAATHFPKEYWWENHFNMLHITTALEGHGYAWWYHLDRARIIWHEFIYLIFGWFLWRANQLQWPANKLALLVWIVVPYVFFSAIHTKMQGYLLFVSPAIFITIALFVLMLIEKTRLNLNIYTKLFLQILIFVVFALALRYGLERAKPFQTQQEQLAVKKAIKNQHFDKNAVIFNAPYAIEIMFYSDGTAYEKIPDEQEISALLERGYELFIRNSANLPPYIIHNKNIRIIELPLMTKY